MELAISLVSGPFGALALACSLLIWMTKVIFPMLREYLETQNKTLAKLVSTLSDTVAAHEKDRDTFVASLEKLGARIERVEDTLKSFTRKD
jgi:uncharacterized coiled-coil protein SlyX